MEWEKNPGENKKKKKNEREMMEKLKIIFFLIWKKQKGKK